LLSRSPCVLLGPLPTLQDRESHHDELGPRFCMPEAEPMIDFA
jgi:hypothetical protein